MNNINVLVSPLKAQRGSDDGERAHRRGVVSKESMKLLLAEARAKAAWREGRRSSLGQDGGFE